MSTTHDRQLLQDFDKYRKARREFVQIVAEKASRQENIRNLMDARVLELLRPLLLDNDLAIKQVAALALGRLANFSEGIASKIVDAGILPDIVAGVATPDSKEDTPKDANIKILLCHYKTNCCFVIRTISKHSPELAQQCVDAGVLEPLVSCFTSFEDKVKEAAAWALGFIASHSPELAHAVVDANAVLSLIDVVQDREPFLKRIGVGAIGNIAKHSSELAQAVINARGITNIAPLLGVQDSKSKHQEGLQDSKLKHQACITLSYIAQHSVDSAELVVQGNIFPQAINCLNDRDANVRSGASTLIKSIVQHTQELAKMVINYNGAAALVSYLRNPDNDPLNAVVAIGFIASFSQSLAKSLIEENAPSVVIDVFKQATLPQIKAPAAWTLGQLGKHSPEHAETLTKLNTLAALLAAHNDPTATEELQIKTKRAMKFIIEKTADIQALQALIKDSPESILQYVLEQISKLLPKNPKARVPFVTSNGYLEVQTIKAEPGSKIRDYIDAINACYPPQAKAFYSPQYPEQLLTDIEAYEA